MNELYREIEEDVRRERFEKLWHSFGKLAVAISAGIILITIAIVVWQDHRQTRAMEKTALLIKGIDRMNLEDYQGALTAFNTLTEDEHSAYYGLAMLHKAGAQLKLGDKDGAARTYQLLSIRETPMGELGKLLAVYKGSPPLVPERGATFYYSLSEWRAWQFLQADKKSSAVDLFTSLANDPDTPSTIRQRIAMVLQYLAPEKTVLLTTALHE